MTQVNTPKMLGFSLFGIHFPHAKWGQIIAFCNLEYYCIVHFAQHSQNHCFSVEETGDGGGNVLITRLRITEVSSPPFCGIPPSLRTKKWREFLGYRRVKNKSSGQDARSLRKKQKTPLRSAMGRRVTEPYVVQTPPIAGEEMSCDFFKPEERWLAPE